MVSSEITQVLLEEFTLEEIHRMSHQDRFEAYKEIREKQQEALLEMELLRKYPDEYNPINGEYDD